eukprot:814534-Rhodomonas_salina.2
MKQRTSGNARSGGGTRARAEVHDAVFQFNGLSNEGARRIMVAVLFGISRSAQSLLWGTLEQITDLATYQIWITLQANLRRYPRMIEVKSYDSYESFRRAVSY